MGSMGFDGGRGRDAMRPSYSCRRLLKAGLGSKNLLSTNY